MLPPESKKDYVMLTLEVIEVTRGEKVFKYEMKKRKSKLPLLILVTKQSIVKYGILKKF